MEAEEDAAPFFAHGSIELNPEEGYDKVQASSFCSKHTRAYLDTGSYLNTRSGEAMKMDGWYLDFEKPRARAYLDTGSGEAKKMDGWYLDSGATHHMTGRRELFTRLDTSVRESVRFNDESKVEITDAGSILFEAKNGEHRVLHGVYFIPALCNSIMSLGQQDEGGSKVEIENGVLKIWDQHRRLLVKVRRGANRLYILHLTPPSLCASPRARMTKHGSGTSASAISTSTHSTSCPGMA